MTLLGGRGPRKKLRPEDLICGFRHLSGNLLEARANIDSELAPPKRNEEIGKVFGFVLGVRNVRPLCLP
jgi:hypothetical protein